MSTPNTGVTGASAPPGGTGAIGDLPAGWEEDILSGLGLSETAQEVLDLDTWLAAEGGGGTQNSANFNPFNTTLAEPGSSVLSGGGPAAAAGVQAYTSWQQGLKATVDTILNSNPSYGYDNIVQALVQQVPLTGFEQAVNGTAWGTVFSVGASYTPSSGGNVANGSNTATAVDNPDAFAAVDSILQSYGLNGMDSWLRSEVTSGASQDQILLDLQQTPQFQQAFPGLAQRQANGYPAISVADYLSYTDNAFQLARAAGLPTGFMTTSEIGALIGNDVSASELSDRINKAYAVVSQAPQETKDLLSQWYGINTGDLAAYYLDPTKALPTLENQITAAQIGTEGVNSGFGAISQGQAEKLQQAGITQATARSTFSQLAKLGTLTNAAPGTGGEQTSISTQNLIDYGFFGADQNELQHVEEARKAPFAGGGGYAANAKGGVGAGFASAQGQVGT